MSETIQCPKAPDAEVMGMLIRANQFIEHAKAHAFSGSDFDAMIAIHNLDNAIEYVLRILIWHFDVETFTGKTIETCELSVLIGELSKFFRDNNCPALPFINEIKVIRSQRNLVQHAMVNPSSDVKNSILHGENFFERVLKKYFDIGREQLKYSTLIADEFVRGLLKSAEDDIQNKSYLEAIVKCRDAFDNAKISRFFLRHGSIWSAPGLYEIKDDYKEFTFMLSSMYDIVALSASNVDIPRYYKYLEFVECIPREFCRDWHGNKHLGRDFERSDAEFCYGFVCNTILTWEMDTAYERNKERPNDVSTYVKRWIGGVSLDGNFVNRQCIYCNIVSSETG